MAERPRRSDRLSRRDQSSAPNNVNQDSSTNKSVRKRSRAKSQVERSPTNGNRDAPKQNTSRSPDPSSTNEKKRLRRTKSSVTQAPSAITSADSSRMDNPGKDINCEEPKSKELESGSHMQIYPEEHDSKPFEIPSGIMRIVTWNVSSFRSVFKSGGFQSYLGRENPHILCLQETKMTEAAMKDIPKIEGYTVYWHHSKRKGYSGVAVFVNDNVASLNVKVERVNEGFGDDVSDSEGRVLSLYLNNGLAIINAYVPNSGGKLARLGYRTETFEPRMRAFLNDTAKSWNVVYCGDLNVAHEEIDIHDSKGNQKSAGHTPEERKEFGRLLESGKGWVDCWRHSYKLYPGYTYYSRRFGPRLKNSGKGWRLDYHVVDKATFEKGVLSDCFVRPNVEGSDHYPLILDYRIDPT
ncbi:Exodeoxyribonuclease [Gracilariopsis chorda]|uniref:DNA-(apurinic or apyrimidinic site) endonuclease n=1 Tax=Gracilariopsis chorda TaxID=448386 RepID=A0A2V3IP61_9FLOR|nr:Exodeoxyribonuclease [Gracilariopsis chorda]|eukprot:PXF43843.1 Exodeoxyribonuclease [Gracilariopsis chorda]